MLYPVRKAKNEIESILEGPQNRIRTILGRETRLANLAQYNDSAKAGIVEMLPVEWQHIHPSAVFHLKRKLGIEDEQEAAA